MDSPSLPDSAADLHARALMPLSGIFMLGQVCAGIAGLDTRDALLILAINQANIAALLQDPAEHSDGEGDSPAPDEERQPVPLSAIASTLRLPYETVRRRARRLHAQGVCRLSAYGAVVPHSFLVSPAYVASALDAYDRLKQFYRDVRAAGLMQPLPPSQFGSEPIAPIRTGLRQVSAYLISSSESLMALTGDLISGLAFVGVLCAGEALPPPVISTSNVARRLGMPHETVRRHCADLVAKGWCVRAPRGFSLTPEILARPEVAAFIRDDSVHVHRLFAELAERGVIDAWEQSGRSESPPP